MIKLKAKEQKQYIGKYAGDYRFVMLAETYSRLSEEKVISEAALRAGMSKNAMRNAYGAIAEVISVWATEGHSVTVPGLGTMRFAVNARTVDSVDKVGAELIKSRKIVFTPNVSIKQELANTAIAITCYDRYGNIIKNITSTDDGNVENPENSENSENSDNQGNQGTQGNQNQQTQEPVTYRIEFEFENGEQDAHDYEVGATINYPEPTTGYHWPEDRPRTMPARNVTVTEEKDSNSNYDDDAGF